MRKILYNRKRIPSLFFIIALLFFCNAAYAGKVHTKENLVYASLQNSSSSFNLSFEERAQCQRAIEEVYWLHRIWPIQNPQPKPSLDTIISEAQIRAKAEDALKKSN